MSIKFIDFAPDVTEKTTFIFTTTDVASFQSALDEANEWISNNDVNIINVETVVLPEMHDEDGTGTTDTKIKLRTSDDKSSHWYQFIRVWYK